ncbi:hypothetical protein ACN27F_30990 [Solwaraspora sp. WMMB335]|uniref:hypothetical protein n=1 Tax=Solwaraspora sp. WMMB335 TaxID=3404118 RepID=UPI003B93BF84
MAAPGWPGPDSDSAGAGAGAGAERGCPPRPIYRLAPVLFDPEDAVDRAVLSVATHSYHTVPATRRRIVRAVLGWSRGRSATAMNAARNPLTPQLVLVILDGVTSGAFDVPGTDRWSRWRLAWRLYRRRAPAGEYSLVPVLSSTEAERIGRHCRWLARRAGLAPARAEAVTRRIVAVLSGATDDRTTTDDRDQG